MSEPISPLRLAASGMRAQSERLRHSAENIANADTPGYRRKLVAFEEAVTMGRPTGEVAAGPVQLDRSALPRIHDPAHPMADAEGYYQGSNVDLVIELADAREAGRSYEANLRMFEQSREMSGALLDLIRR
ncbi:flagellar basal body rod protein FlgC [Paracoccus sp. 1_MG-2023]|uniref:flagellar basal body rod protein FlgC n=1 Tax=unclassified Paracoccus (in: a-proteobacteria) TaxID=2688777 RepID=UPI001C097EAF|nr:MULTISPECIES: flagellar basal body rod protein FlgC [unclassified Paracoccus (in: a-proteobacteria)]MBU2956893.1 flagellar basal body rod protein FlgC [Paracoccus sp. C2R09]MDO6668091.1 flagellar basal body rod protein FlgC [Paracoccus sp. 1_MG-2023]